VPTAPNGELDAGLACQRDDPRDVHVVFDPDDDRRSPIDASEKTIRASSYSGSSGPITRPPTSVRSFEMEMLELLTTASSQVVSATTRTSRWNSPVKVPRQGLGHARVTRYASVL
jgi:hypothetical protein